MKNKPVEYVVLIPTKVVRIPKDRARPAPGPRQVDRSGLFETRDEAIEKLKPDYKDGEEVYVRLRRPDEQ